MTSRHKSPSEQAPRQEAWAWGWSHQKEGLTQLRRPGKSLGSEEGQAWELPVLHESQPLRAVRLGPLCLLKESESGVSRGNRALTTRKDAVAWRAGVQEGWPRASRLQGGVALGRHPRELPLRGTSGHVDPGGGTLKPLSQAEMRTSQS